MVLKGSMRRSHVVILAFACAAEFLGSCCSFHVLSWRSFAFDARRTTTSTSSIRLSTTTETEGLTVTGGFVPKVPATAVCLLENLRLFCVVGYKRRAAHITISNDDHSS